MFLNERRGRRRVAIGLAIIFVGLVFYLSRHTYSLFPQTQLLFPSKNVFSSYVLKPSVDLIEYSLVSSSINLLNYSEVAKEILLTEKPPFNCPVVEVFDVKFPICIFPLEKDYLISIAAQSGNKYWEKILIDRLLDSLRRLNLSERHEREIVFVDLGTNIGTYSLPILRSGFKVVSVEAYWEAARRLAFSVHLAANLMDSKRITILHNAISNVTGSMLNLRVNPNNAGAADVVSMESCLTSECSKTMVRTITLDTLLPFVVDKSSGFTIRKPQIVMKVDIEGSEPRVFTEKTAAKFFQETDVIAVQIELLPYSHAAEDARVIRMREAMMSFFISRDYSIRYASPSGRYLTLNECLDAFFRADILLTKKGLDNII